jgi:hypothetical protein
MGTFGFGLFWFGVCGVTTPGGAEEGGTVPAGVEAGGNVPGGVDVEGGATAGDVIEGGTVPGDDAEGGKVPGVDAAGGVVPGDVAEGGAVPGDDVEGGGAVPGDVPDAPPGGAACAPAAVARPNAATRMIDFNLAISLTFLVRIYPFEPQVGDPVSLESAAPERAAFARVACG